MTGVSPVAGANTAGFGSRPYPQDAHPDGERRGRRGESRSGGTWHQALSELEGEVRAAEDTLSRGRADEIAAWGRRSEDWIAPSGLGPLPEDLRERAMQLLQHQLAVAEALVERITQSQRQRDLAARMSYGPARPAAAFIDKAL